MKLEAKAKPIKFNIEYKSFDEIKRAFNETENFSYEKFYEMFKDERLFRWLKQSGEEANAQKVEERYQLWRTNNNNNIIDRIVFLSLFSDKIEAFLQKNKKLIGKKLLADLLCNEEYDLVKEMYRLTKENNKEEWAELIKRNIKENNIEKYFNDEDFFWLLDSTDWGEIFAAQYRFEHNRQLLVEKALHKKGVYIAILGVFVDKTRKDWEDYLKHEQELDSLIKLYSISVIKQTDFDWPRLFANATHDPENDIPWVKNVLKEDSEKLKIFREYCENKGFEEAKKLLETPSEKLINLFLADPTSYGLNSCKTNDFDKEQELDNFLCWLAALCRTKKEWGKTYTDRGIEKVQYRRYKNEGKFLIAMYYYCDSPHLYKERIKTRLNNILQNGNYPPAVYMYNWLKDNTCRTDIVSEHIEKYKKHDQFVKYVVRHLIDNKFA